MTMATTDDRQMFRGTLSRAERRVQLASVRAILGAKWNALPRRTDASQGMSDGELIARALREVANEIARTHSNDCSPWDEDVTAELDRRAAARKESK